jgi:hypothetical protein
MVRRTIQTILLLIACFALAAGAVAQTASVPIPRAANPGQGHGAAESNAGCQRIVAECRRLGFIQGQWKKDNGLWRDCFDPVVKGGQPTRDGHPVNVPVSESDVQSCRSAVEHRR